MAKKKRQEIDLSKVKELKVSFNLSVPKEQFDELLRKMAHLSEKTEAKEQDKEKKKN